MKIINSFTQFFWLALLESSGLISRLLNFQYTPIIFLKKTHLHENHIGAMNGISLSMLD